MIFFLKKLCLFSVVLFISISMLFPGILIQLKVVSIACFLLFSLILFLIEKKNIIIDRYIFYLFIYLFAVNSFFVLLGIVNGAVFDATIEYLFIYLLFPLFYFILVVLFGNCMSLRFLTNLLMFISIITSYIVISHHFRISGFYLPGYKLLFYLYPELSDSFKTIAFTGSNSYLPRVLERLIFLAPFSVSLIMVEKNISYNKFISWVNIFLVILAVSFSERRAMYAVLFLALLVVFFYSWIISKKKHIFLIIVLFIFMFLPFSMAINSTVINTIMESGMHILDNCLNGSLDTRTEQFSLLVSATSESPLLGKGFGATVPDYCRSLLHPWRFELTYVALLFQTGTVGLFLYGISFILLLFIIIKSVKKNSSFSIPYLFGLFGVLFSVSTNPYLNYISGQLILFIPIVVFNNILLFDKKSAEIKYENLSYNNRS